MASATVADYLLSRLRAWGVDKVFGYAGDGINGLLAAWGRADNQPQFVQARHEEMAAFEAVGYAKFSGRVGVCAATSGPGAIHLLNGLYDAKLDHVPVVAIVGQTNRSRDGRLLPAGGGPAQPVQGRRRASTCRWSRCPSSCPTCSTGRSGPRSPSAHRPRSSSRPTCRSWSTRRRATRSRWCRPAWGSSGPTAAPDDAASGAPPRSSTPARRSRSSRPGRPRRARRGRRGGRPARRGRREGAAGQGRAVRRPALRHRVDRPAGHPAELRDDARLRHAADRRVQLPLHPVPAGARPGPGGPDRHRRRR